ncbi:ATP-dependent zinc metalloprotease FtsH [Candidatus Profftella armatura (Diaphorina cf. continua)]|uniref:ATP-dependent zinc metalloprotease FtsH n=1 Tax=Candidatus Profftella armatura (Diaphorina cf. continua) TaxID=2661583 RepID=A0A7R7ABM9_9PROT|nr:ATP-dependent zinc metalloprotease FtsH [Candidatus Profftella armatura (Diaphorina cf. continua)]BCG49518.1 ATP-dependent zinc metalloprotease FtsH [Candidatus Profftella armatura (Diaphorina cf. continua)]
MKNIFSKAIIWTIMALMLFIIFKQFDNRDMAKKVTPIAYSDFILDVKLGRIKNVIIEDKNIFATTKNGKKIKTVTTYLDRGLIGDLLIHNVKFDIKQIENQSSFISQVFISWFPMLLLIGIWVFFMRQIQGGGKGIAFSFGKSKARMLKKNSNTITFSDVAGCDEAKAEVYEIVDFLRDPDKFQKLGGKIPKGVLMIGPPGTGKTLLARAIAGEAKVPFFTISGSDFVEMFVGVGASRVRDMFKNAKKNAPCIIFIDEIDAVGRHRGIGMGGANDEREQTLNQMLVEMDGFEVNSGVIVIAATNRVDVLDKALLRPGRLDRQVIVGLPDIRGREQILYVHIKKIPIANDVKINILARGTPGFSGADLANLINEAVLFAARNNKHLVEMSDFENAKDKIIMGPERKSTIMREEERRNTAYHESGHAIVAKLLPKSDPVYKVTIMPRGLALGLTWQLPKYDRVNMYKDKILEDIAILFGGRISEEIFMNQISTGACNDFERATKLARLMVTRYGMSENLGAMVYEDSEKDAYFGKISSKTISEATQQKVDTEIRNILDTQYKLSKKLLENNRDKVDLMAKTLLELETIDADQINDIMLGNNPKLSKKL